MSKRYYFRWALALCILLAVFGCIHNELLKTNRPYYYFMQMDDYYHDIQYIRKMIPGIEGMLSCRYRIYQRKTSDRHYRIVTAIEGFAIIDKAKIDLLPNTELWGTASGAYQYFPGMNQYITIQPDWYLYGGNTESDLLHSGYVGGILIDKANGILRFYISPNER